MPPRKWNHLGRLVAMLSLTTAFSCATAEKESGCSDAECYGECTGKAWTDLKESFWRFEAFCVNGDTCNCFNSCDPERCNQYCIDEESRTGGECDFLSCVCTGPIQDAGPNASEDCSDTECYDVCMDSAWADLNESYWKFEASCVNDDTCNCFNSCDPEQCNQYCVEEMSRTGGDCDFLGCFCTDPIEDAGPDASE